MKLNNKLDVRCFYVAISIPMKNMIKNSVDNRISINAIVFCICHASFRRK